MKLPTPSIAPVLAFAAVCFGGTLAQALPGTPQNQLFAGYLDAQIRRSDPTGTPESWTTVASTPRAFLAQGGDLLVGTSAGDILRMHHETGEVLATQSTGLRILDLALHEGHLLVAAEDELIHRYNLQTGEEASPIQPTSTPASIEVAGDRIYVGSRDGRIETAVIAGGPWTTVVDSAPGRITDLVVGGDTLYFTRANSNSVFIGNHLGDDGSDMGDLREFGMLEPPTALALTGQSLLVGTHYGAIYDYDVPSFFTNGQVWTNSPIISLFVEHRESVGTSFCEGLACPCGNTSTDGGCMNSTGSGAVLEATGNPDLSLGDVDLAARGLPANGFALLFMGQGSGSASFGDGRLCVAGSSLFRFPVRATGPEGIIEEFGASQHASDHFPVTGHIHPGSTWNFQAWFRDPQGACGSGFNTSNGWTLTFAD